MGGTFAQIYAIVRQIPAGKVAYYGQIARLAGMPRAARLVGNALAACPANSLVPCHRVVDKQGNTKPAFDTFSKDTQRLMLEAEKFGRPVISFIDTPGAYPGKEAEEHGQSAAIAENIARMSTLRVPVIAVVTGEGSSGGALGIGVADDVWMLENAVYSVLSPEGFATILWKDEKRTEEACRVMKMTAGELYAQGLCDRVIAEPRGGLKTEDKEAMREFGASLREELTNRMIDLMKLSPDELTERRYGKYRHFEGRMAPALTAMFVTATMSGRAVVQ